MIDITTFVEGVVVDTNDPQQMGRLKVWCPSRDGENKDPAGLPWVVYVSPLAGQTVDYPAGSESKAAKGLVSFGFWAIPKKGTAVIVGFLYGDCNKRFYIGSYFPDHGNRSLPVGRNTPTGPVTDTYETLDPTSTNLKAQFGGKLTAPEAMSRGVNERMVAQPVTAKDGKEGYQPGVVDPDLDPQTYCITTPGRHSIILQDNPENGRLRLRTADGHQVIFDDANERIYISTAKGNTWVELDSDGHMHMYGAASVSVTSGADINMTAKGNFSVHAGGNINLAASGHLRASACTDLSLTGDGAVAITSGGQFDILAAGNLIQQGAKIHLNGPGAKAAACADKTTIIPQHEPWTRPVTKGKRGKHWKP